MPNSHSRRIHTPAEKRVEERIFSVMPSTFLPIQSMYIFNAGCFHASAARAFEESTRLIFHVSLIKLFHWGPLVSTMSTGYVRAPRPKEVNIFHSNAGSLFPFAFSLSPWVAFFCRDLRSQKPPASFYTRHVCTRSLSLFLSFALILSFCRCGSFCLARCHFCFGYSSLCRGYIFCC